VWNPLTMDLDGIINQTNMKQDCKWKKKQNENQNRFADVNLMQKVLSEFNMKDRQIELVSEAES
jgi:coenzyme F420-reducing hydrogenase delta subunit